MIRALLYTRLPEQSVDERGFRVLQAIRKLQPANRRLPFGELKVQFRDQYLLLRLDEERAVRAIPRLLPQDERQRANAFDAIREVVTASGSLSEPAETRLKRLAGLFGVPSP